MEAELVAGSLASTEGIWLIRLAIDFHHDFMLIPLFTDNQLFISFLNNKINNNQTKHINIHFHYTRHQVDTGLIKLHYVPTLENPADILTKLLSPHKHTHLLDVLEVRHVWGAMLSTHKRWPYQNTAYSTTTANFTNSLTYPSNHYSHSHYYKSTAAESHYCSLYCLTSHVPKQAPNVSTDTTSTCLNQLNGKI